MKRTLIVCTLLLSLLFVSCTTIRNVEGTNADGSPVWTTAIPSSNKYLYGVGSAKFSNAQNSYKAAEAQAFADLAGKVSSTIKESTSVYANDASGVLRDAYESIILVSTNITLKGVTTVDKWMAPDGTAWYLVSLEVKKLPKIYKDAANDYLNQLEEKKLSAEKKLSVLLEEMGENLDENGKLLKKLAEEKVDSIKEEANLVISRVDVDALAQILSDKLSSMGYEV